jgi:hypothetical protein
LAAGVVSGCGLVGALILVVASIALADSINPSTIVPALFTAVLWGIPFHDVRRERGVGS